MSAACSRANRRLVFNFDLTNYGDFHEIANRYFILICIMKNISLIFSLFVLLGCSNKNSNIETTSGLSVSGKITLQENLTFLTDIKSFEFLGDGTFFVLTKAGSIIRYNTSGEQIGQISTSGQGPLEVYSPGAIRAYNSHLFVWDDSLMKFVEFDQEGQAITEFFGFARSVSNFEVDDKYIYAYQNNSPGMEFVNIYSKEKGEIIASLGETSNEQIVNDLHSKAGGILVLNGELVFAPSSKLFFYRNDIGNNFSPSFSSIVNENFIVDRVQMDAVQFINDHRNEAIQYMFNNSVLTGIYPLKDGIFVTTEVGEFGEDVNKSKKGPKREMFLMLNSKFQVVKESFLPILAGWTRSVYGSDGQRIFRLTKEDGVEEVVYSLEVVNF